MNDKGIVEIAYCIKNIPDIYSETERTWNEDSLSYCLRINKEEVGVELIARKDNVLPDEIKTSIEFIDNRIDDLFMIYNFKASDFNSSYEKNVQNYCVEGLGSVSIDGVIDIEGIKRWMSSGTWNSLSFATELVKAEMEGTNDSPKREFPDLSAFNNINDILKHYLLTGIQTKKLSLLSENYPDDMLKRWFLILEKFEDDPSNDDYKNIKSARNFVSHKAVNAQETMKTIKQELDAYVLPSGEYVKARFDRLNQDHIKFVQKYAVKAEERARRLLMQQLEKTP